MSVASIICPEVRRRAYRSGMTSPYTFSEALQLVESTVDDTTIVTNFVANTSTVPPGVAMIEADINALLNLALYYGQVGGDLVNVFAQQFQAIILETLAAAQLASSIVGNIEQAIAIALVPPAAAANPTLAAAATSSPPTASQVLAQVQQQSAAALTALNTAFTDINDQTTIPAFNTTAGIEAQFVGGQILFQQNLDTFLNSLPSTLTPAEDANQGLIASLQNLLLILTNLTEIFPQIYTNCLYAQPISLVLYNFIVFLGDSAIMLDIFNVATTYGGFAYDLLVGGSPVIFETPGSYSVAIPTGATWVDIILLGAGAGGGGYNTSPVPGGNGGNTTATPTGGSTYTAGGGYGGIGGDTVAATPGSSTNPLILSYNGYIDAYTGGIGGNAGYAGPGGGSIGPGGGGGGGGDATTHGGSGGNAGAWATFTIPITAGMTEITGTIGAPGQGGAATNTAHGGNGGPGMAVFRFYSQKPS
jgi:hypothetical protein